MTEIDKLDKGEAPPVMENVFKTHIIEIFNFWLMKTKM